jgi:hypothetical protein
MTETQRPTLSGQFELELNGPASLYTRRTGRHGLGLTETVSRMVVSASLRTYHPAFGLYTRRAQFGQNGFSSLYPSCPTGELSGRRRGDSGD